MFQNSLARAALSDQLTPKQPSLTRPELLAAPDGVNLRFILENTVIVLDENKNPGNARSAPPSPPPATAHAEGGSRGRRGVAELSRRRCGQQHPREAFVLETVAHHLVHNIPLFLK